MVMGRNMAILILDEAGKERATHRVTYGSRLFVDDGDKVKRGQRLAEWDPYTRPILTEVEGTVAFEDLVDGISVSGNDRRSRPASPSARSSTGVRRRAVRTSSRPSSSRTPRARSASCRRAATPASCCRSRPFCRSSRAQPCGRATCSRVSRWKAPRPRTSPAVCRAWPNCSKPVVRRITPSSPRSTARSASAATTRTSAASSSSRTIDAVEPVEYLIPKGKPFHLQDGDVIEKGDYILDGNPAPHDILAIKGVEALASYLVNEIQEVYRLQGVVDQRQAHRGDRSPDAAEGRDHRCRATRPTSRATMST